MEYNNRFDTILELQLSGPLAHFRKFYTNASSLTYSIPPRTVVCGLLASILQKKRDSYYKLMSSKNLGLAISIAPGSSFKKQFYTMNYVRYDTGINDVSDHKQCRMELLMPRDGKELAWILYVAFKKGEHTELDSIENRIINKDLGYDIYLGQRQFRAGINHVRTYQDKDIHAVPESRYLDSAVEREQIKSIDTDSLIINIERMPLEQTTEDYGKNKSVIRRSIRFGDVFMEASGKRLTGMFCNVLELNNETRTRISML